jgi:hypothetical protein
MENKSSVPKFSAHVYFVLGNIFRQMGWLKINTFVSFRSVYTAGMVSPFVAFRESASHFDRKLT